MADKDIQEFGRFHQGYLTSYIQLADTKAAAVFTVVGGILAYVLSKNPFRHALDGPLSWPSAIAWSTTAALVLAAGLSFHVLLPRLDRTGKGPIFFLSVVEYGSAAKYGASVKAMSAAEMSEAMLQQSYDLSTVCRKKYRQLRSSMIVGLAAVALTAISMWKVPL